MESEASGKTDHWKNKLTELQGLPREIFNGEAAWDKLYVRMNEKRGKKRMVWYWAAAAVLIFGLAIPLLPGHDNKSSIVRSDRINSISGKNIEPLLKNGKNNIVENIQSVVHPKNNFNSKNKRKENYL